MDLRGKKILRAPRRSRIRPRIDWDDLRYVLAVADAGSLAAAAASLRVNRTTVLRRVNAFERNHAVRLFERLPVGYVLTAAGEEILAAARGFEATVATLENKLAGQASRAEGLIRVTTTDTLLASVLPDVFTAFKQANPRITLNVTVSNEQLNLSRRQADVAIRPVGKAPETLIGRRVGRVAFAVYTSVDRAPGDPTLHELSDRHWIGPDDTLADTSIARWLRASVKASQYSITVGSLVAMRELCAAGLGSLPSTKRRRTIIKRKRSYTNVYEPPRTYIWRQCRQFPPGYRQTTFSGWPRWICKALIRQATSCGPW